MTPIDAIAIVTARRPAALARCLESYARNAADYGRRPVFLVFDDSTAASDREASASAARAAASRYAVDVRCIGLAEKLALVRDLVKSGVAPADVIKFAFFDAERCGRPTTGANRNALLCVTHGRPVLSVDDDTVCMTYRPVGSSDAPIARRAADDTRDPSEVWPLTTDDEADDVCRREALDYVGEHERWLGRAVTFDEAGRHDAARVALTVNGFVGDCGWGTPAAYLFLGDRSFDRLTSSDERYAAYTTSRRMVRAVRQAALSPRADDFMSGFFAVDNRLLLPPFMPVCRGEDRVFARIWSRCCPDAWFAHLPLVLQHEPLEARAFWPGEIRRSAAGIDLSVLLCTLIDRLALVSRTDVAARMRDAGTQLAALGSGTAAAFAEAAAPAIRDGLATIADDLEMRAASNRARPRRWRRDALAYAAMLRATSARADVHVPLDLRLGRSLEDAEALTRRIVLQFGQLLTWWPAILSHRARAVAA